MVKFVLTVPTIETVAVAANPRQADAYLLIGTVAQTTGQKTEARSAYERALALVHSDAERRFLEQRLAELAG